MNRARMIVCLEESIFIHSTKDMNIIHHIDKTAINKEGICDIAQDDKNSYLAYPGSSTRGELVIFDALNVLPVVTISAHSGKLVAVKLSPSGKQVATASERGTVIRVYNTTNGSKIYEFRRGLSRTASIHSLSFSPCGLFLACSSNTQTIHIFNLSEATQLKSLNKEDDENNDDSTEETKEVSSASWMVFLGDIVSSATNFPSW